MSGHKWELYKDKAGEFRVRFKYNSEAIFSTEGYSSKQSAMKAIMSAKKNMRDAVVEDITATQTDRVTVENERRELLGALERREMLEEAIAPYVRRTVTAKLNASAYRMEGEVLHIYIDLMMDGVVLCTLDVTPDEILTHYGFGTAKSKVEIKR